MLQVPIFYNRPEQLEDLLQACATDRKASAFGPISKLSVSVSCCALSLAFPS